MLFPPLFDLLYLFSDELVVRVSSVPATVNFCEAVMYTLFAFVLKEKPDFTAGAVRVSLSFACFLFN